MGLTNFPNGVNAGDSGTGTATFAIGGTAVNPFNYLIGTGVAPKYAAGTVVVPTGGAGTAFTVSGMTTIGFVNASPYSTVASVAGYANCVASQAGGTITIIGVSSAGTASTASGSATWFAIGS